MRRLTCLILLGAALAAGPGLAQVNPPTAVALSPALSSAPISRSGCTPINPCAVLTPDLGNASSPVPEASSQPDRSSGNEAPASAAAAGNAPAPAAAANANCPPAGARGGFAGAGRGQFAGRGGEGRGFAGFGGEGRGFARSGGEGRGFGGRGEGRGFGGANGPGGRAAQFAQNGRSFARGAAGCLPSPGGSGPAAQAR